MKIRGLGFVVVLVRFKSRIGGNYHILDTLSLLDLFFLNSDHVALEKAVIDGMGIGLFPTFLALENKDLELVMPLVDKWKSDLWIVTHVDLHRTAKVKVCSDLITKQAQSILSKNSNINRKA